VAAERRDLERREAERLQAERAETARREAVRREAERAEAARLEAEWIETARLETARLEAARLEAARIEAERQAAARAEAERLEAERLDADRREADRRDAERRESERQATERVAAERAAAAARPRHAEDTLVMVVDDSKVVRVKTSRLLAPLRYRIALAEDGADALARIDAEMPHVVITDVEMPDVDGFELTRRLRADRRTAHLPIIMVTSADDRLGEAALEAGVTVLLGKPYDDQVLIGHIARLTGVADAQPMPA
jgi:CheY-like chemotaxis protein